MASWEILDWLTSLPGGSKDLGICPVFTSFSFGYDVAQIMKDIPFKRRREVCRNEYLPKDSEEYKPTLPGSYKLAGPYGINYAKGRSISIARVRCGDGGEIIRTNDGKIDYYDRITIFDAFSFYGESCKKVVASLAATGYASESEVEEVLKNKDRRDELGTTRFDEIKHYCERELSLLSRSIMLLRDGFDAMSCSLFPPSSIRLNKWAGPGCPAGVVLKKAGVLNHYPEKGAAYEIVPGGASEFQKAAHHAAYGGRIEALKQGFVDETHGLFCYDLNSPPLASPFHQCAAGGLLFVQDKIGLFTEPPANRLKNLTASHCFTCFGSLLREPLPVGVQVGSFTSSRFTRYPIGSGPMI